MREASERTDDEFEKPSETLDDFRERVVENHGPDGLSEKEQKEEATDSWTRGESPENKHQPGVEIDGGPEQPRQVDLNNPEPSKEAVGQEAKEPIEERAKEDGNPAERISEKGEERSVGEQGKPWAHDGQELPSRIDDQALEGKEAGSDPPPSERGTLAEQPETDVLATVGPSRPSVEQAKPSPTEDIREDGLAAAEIESRTRSENQITVTVQEQPERRDKTSAEPELDTPALRSLPYDSTASGYKVEEPRVLEAVNYGKGAVLRVPKTDLEKAGFEPEAGENAIVEVKLRNQEAGELETVFVRMLVLIGGQRPTLETSAGRREAGTSSSKPESTVRSDSSEISRGGGASISRTSGWRMPMRGCSLTSTTEGSKWQTTASPRAARM